MRLHSGPQVRFGRARAGTATIVTAAPRPRILVVEDNRLSRELIEQLLCERYDVVTAEDGAQGVKLALSEHPDVILMDLSLPGIDGWTAARMIRAQPASKSIPMVAVTGHSMREQRERILAAGFVACISKPIDEDALLRAIEEPLRDR